MIYIGIDPGLTGAVAAIDEQATLHRPTDQAAVMATVRALAAQGLKPHDISDALRIGVAAVSQALSMLRPTDFLGSAFTRS